MDKILECEKKIIAYRQELNQLIQDYQLEEAENAIIEKKIAYLEQEISYLKDQLEIIKREIREKKDAKQENCETQGMNQVSVGEKEHDVMKEAERQKERAAMKEAERQKERAAMKGAERQKEPIQEYPVYYKQQGVNEYNQSNPYQSVPKKKVDFESMIGKNGMGIFASILIFISLICFATLVFPTLNDTIKMISMYVVSFAFLVVGMYLSKKDRNNKLYLSITACGIGAIYISLLVSNLYFKVMNDMVLLGFIFLWAVFICLLCRWRSWIFQIVGQIGIFIAINFGIEVCIGNEMLLYTDRTVWKKFLILLIFFIVTQIIFLIANIQKQYIKNIVNFISIICGSFEFMLELDLYTSEYTYATKILLILFLVFSILSSFFLFSFDKKGKVAFGIINSLCFFEIITSLWGDSATVFAILLSVLGLVGIEYRFRNEERQGSRIFQIFVFIVLQWFLLNMNSVPYLELASKIIFNAAFVVLFAVYGFYKKDRVYKNTSIVYFALFILNAEMNDIANLVVGLILFLIFGYLLKTMEQYSTKVKVLLYSFSLVFLAKDLILVMVDVAYESSIVLFFAIMTLVNAVVKKTKFGQNWMTGEEERGMIIVTNIANAILMFAVLCYMNSFSNPALHMCIVVIGLTLFTINAKNQLEKYGMKGGIYVGIKFTLFLNVVLHSFETPNYLVSICCFLLAIGSIVIGVCFAYKSLRVYGLGLSLLSIVKLVLIDISYDNTIGHAFSFFLCGILCFVISMIYNYVDKYIRK